MTQAANGYRTAVTRTLRPIVMASVLADELSHELYLSMDHSSSSLSAFELAQAWTMLLLIAAVMWQRRRMVMVTGAISLVLALTRGTANGLEIVLIPAVSLVAQLTMSWRGRALVHAALQLVTLGCVVHAPGGQNLEMWVVFTLIQLGSTLLAWTGDWILTRRERLLNEAAAYREESSALRSREMSRLADEMEQTITGGLTRIRAISSSRPTDAELAAALDEVAAENRAVVSDLRTLVHGLRTSAQRESPTAPTGHPCATRWFRSAAVVLLLGVFVTLVAMPASIGQLAVCWPLTVVLVMVLWPRLAPPGLWCATMSPSRSSWRCSTTAWSPAWSPSVSGSWCWAVDGRPRASSRPTGHPSRTQPATAPRWRVRCTTWWATSCPSRPCS